MSLEEARAALYLAAQRHAAKPDDGETQRELCKAASEYHKARMATASGAAAQTGGQATPTDKAASVMPFGRSKGIPVHAATKGDIEWTMGALERSISDPAKSRFLEANQALLDVLRAELARRP
jgi:hypothetical protein